MVEKRKQPPRDRRESAAKRRAAPSNPQPQQSSAKKKAATPVQPVPSPDPPEEPLPTSIKDGQPLPTLPKAQPANLSIREYQSYAESAVAAAAVQRSRAKWLNDCVFEKYWTKPSKKKSQGQPAIQNPPRESMIKLGPCSMVIEPHHFEIMLYTVRQPHTQQPTQYAPAQRPIVQYTPPSNFHQYQPMPPANNARHLSAQSPSSQTPPPPLHPQQQNRLEQPARSNAPTPPPPAPPPRQEPPPQQTQDSSSQQNKTSPDPVIQMLATRAATNPDLKALMRVVASNKASQEQLRAFQAHIDELNAIIASRRQQEQRTSSPQIKQDATPARGQPTPQQTGNAAVPTPSPSPLPPPTVPPNAPQSHTHPPGVSSARSSPSQNAYPNQAQSARPPIRSKDPQQHHPNEASYQYPVMRQAMAPQKTDPQAVVFEFMVPGHSTHAGNGDRFLFPPNTILDYFPGGTTVIASFLVIKKVDPSAPSSDTAGTGTAKPKSKKSKASLTPGTGTPDGTPALSPAPEQEAGKQNTSSEADKQKDGKTETGTETSTSKPSQKSTVKEYYQPVTMRLHVSNPRTLEPLARVVRPQAEVRQYMNDVMDRMDRADIGYLALRLPRESQGRNGGPGDEENGVESAKPDTTSRSKIKSEAGGETDGERLDEDDEELKEFYDMPSSLVPLR